jgi:hypothetical protein
MPPTKVKRQHIKQGYLDKNAGFIKLDGLLSVTPILQHKNRYPRLYQLSGLLIAISEKVDIIAPTRVIGGCLIITPKATSTAPVTISIILRFLSHMRNSVSGFLPPY